MKKILLTLALAVLVCLPLSVNAKISVKDGMNCSKATLNSDGKYYVDCKFSVTTTANESISSFSIDLNFKDSSNIKLDENSIKGSGAFEAAAIGNSISFNAATAQTGSKIELGSFRYYILDPAKDCSFVFVPTGTDIEEEEETVQIENPETGSAISYVAIGAGLLLVAGAYALSRKNTKMYKI